MKHLLSFLLLCFGPLAAHAYDFCDNGIYYNILPDLLIEVTRDDSPDATGYAGDITIPSMVEHEGKMYFVNSIGAHAFNGSRVTSVTLPFSVSDIGIYAFSGCTSLVSVDFRGVESIGSFAFKGCSQLASISIPSCTKSIGDEAFNGCKALTEISVPDNVERLGRGVFEDCSSLTYAALPRNLTRISIGTFRNCTALQTVVFPDGLAEIDHYAFRGCTALTSVTLPYTVTTIGDNAFEYCESLTQIVIPPSCTIIGFMAFNPCYALTDVTNLATVPQVLNPNDHVFSTFGTLHVLPESKAAYENDRYWKNFTIVGDATPMPNPAICVTGTCGEKTRFSYNTETGELVISGMGEVAERNEYTYPWDTYQYTITSVTVEADVTNIPQYAFHSSPLTKVSIAATVERIGRNAFSDCTSLEAVSLPASVRSVDRGAFARCTALTTLTLTEGLV